MADATWRAKATPEAMLQARRAVDKQSRARTKTVIPTCWSCEHPKLTAPAAKKYRTPDAMRSTCKKGRVLHVRLLCYVNLHRCGRASYRVKGARIDASGPHVVLSCFISLPLYTVHSAATCSRRLQPLRSLQTPSCVCL